MLQWLIYEWKITKLLKLDINVCRKSKFITAILLLLSDKAIKMNVFYVSKLRPIELKWDMPHL